MENIKEEIIRRIEERKINVSRNILLNSHELDLDSAVKYAILPYDICIDIINQVIDI